MTGNAPGAIPAGQAGPATAPAATATTTTTDATAPGTRPFICVVRGQPNEAELAAVVTVLAARIAAAPAAPGPASAFRSAWSDRSRLMRDSIVPSPGAWRRSALPR